MSKQVGLGSTLEVSTDGTSYESLGFIVDGFSTDAQADDIETTVLADTFKSFAQGQRDAGSLSFDLAFDADDTSQHVITGMFNNGTLGTWRVTYPDTQTESFTGYVNGFGRAVQKDSMITSSVSVKLSGDAGLTDS